MTYATEIPTSAAKAVDTLEKANRLRIVGAITDDRLLVHVLTRSHPTLR